jgi:hypothetical protein
MTASQAYRPSCAPVDPGAYTAEIDCLHRSSLPQAHCRQYRLHDGNIKRRRVHHGRPRKAGVLVAFELQ